MTAMTCSASAPWALCPPEPSMDRGVACDAYSKFSEGTLQEGCSAQDACCRDLEMTQQRSPQGKDPEGFWAAREEDPAEKKLAERISPAA